MLLYWLYALKEKYSLVSLEAALVAGPEALISITAFHARGEELPILSSGMSRLLSRK